ncbi:transposase [Mesorhizobium sp. M0643]
MNGTIFEHYLEMELAPDLSPGDVVILDNVGFHKNERAAQLVRQRGAWLLFFLVVSCGRRAQIVLTAFFPALSARQAG